MSGVPVSAPSNEVRAPATPHPSCKRADRECLHGEYLRNGTTNLLAALRAHHGEVSGMTSQTRNRWDFLAFLQQLEGEIAADQESTVQMIDPESTI